MLQSLHVFYTDYYCYYHYYNNNNNSFLHLWISFCWKAEDLIDLIWNDLQFTPWRWWEDVKRAAAMTVIGLHHRIRCQFTSSATTTSLEAQWTASLPPSLSIYLSIPFSLKSIHYNIRFHELECFLTVHKFQLFSLIDDYRWLQMKIKQ